MIKVALVDDHIVVRSGFAQLLLPYKTDERVFTLPPETSRI